MPLTLMHSTLLGCFIANATPVVAADSEAAAASAKCQRSFGKSEFTDADLTPDNLQRIANSGQGTEGDLICCLPEKLRKSYVILPSSESAQYPVGPHGRAPRVIFYQLEDPTDPSKGVAKAISFTIGRSPVEADGTSARANADIGQRYSIEIMSHDGNSVLDYSDLHFVRDQAEHTSRPLSAQEKDQLLGTSQSKVTVAHNPQECRTCHSDSQGQMYPKFQQNPIWLSAFGSFGNGSLSCPTSKEIEQDGQKRKEFGDTLKQKNSHYNCLVGVRDKLAHTAPDRSAFGPGNLDPSNPGNLTQANFQFSNALAATNNPRLVEKIKQTPDYQRYKFLIAGSLLGCSFDDNDLSQWIPPPRVAELTGRHFTSQKPLLADNAGALVDDVTCKANCDLPGNFISTANGCKTAALMKSRVKQLLSGKESLLHQYIADSNVQRGRRWLGGGGVDQNADSEGRFRYVMQGRGVDVQNWSSSINADSSFENPVALGTALLNSDPDMKDLGEAMANSLKAAVKRQKDLATVSSTSSKKTLSGSIFGPQQACDSLRDRSLNAFGDTHSNTHQPAETTQ